MIFKLLKYLVILIVVVVIGAVVAAYLGINYAVKKVVQSEGTAQLNVPTTLDSASLGLFSGSIGLKGFDVANPAGFTAAPHILEVSSLSVATTGITHLMDKPLHVTNITLNGTHLVIEQKAMTVNVKALMDGLPSAGKPSPTPSTDKSTTTPTKLIIDKLTIAGSTVDVIPDAGGLAGGAVSSALGGLGDLGKQASAVAEKKAGGTLKPMTVTLPDINLANLGNADGKGQGVEVKDIVAAVLQAVASDAAKKANLPIPSGLLEGDFKDKVGEQVQDQIKKLPGGAGDLLNGVLGGKKN